MDKWKRRLEEVEEALQKLQNTLGGGWWKLHSKTKGKLLTQQQLFAYRRLLHSEEDFHIKSNLCVIFHTLLLAQRS